MISVIRVKRVREILKEAKDQLKLDPDVGGTLVEMQTIEIYQNRIFDLVLREIDTMEEEEEEKKKKEEEEKKNDKPKSV